MIYEKLDKLFSLWYLVLTVFQDIKTRVKAIIKNNVSVLFCNAVMNWFKLQHNNISSVVPLPI